MAENPGSSVSPIPIAMGIAIGSVVVLAIVLSLYGLGEVVPLVIASPFALFMLWQSLHVDDFRFGQHDEDTPYSPEARHRAMISYRGLEHARASH